MQLMTASAPLRNMLVAVIGAGGHVSKYIVPELLKMGFAVRVLSRSGSHDNPNCEVFTGDALNANDINNFLSGADAVINCIGQLKNASGFYARVTENIMSAMQRNRLRRYILLANFREQREALPPVSDPGAKSSRPCLAVASASSTRRRTTSI